MPKQGSSLGSSLFKYKKFLIVFDIKIQSHHLRVKMIFDFNVKLGDAVFGNLIFGYSKAFYKSFAQIKFVFH